MPIDDKEYGKPATQGDVAGVAIQSTVALQAISKALLKLASGTSNISDEIETIQNSRTRLSETFDRLVGWTEK